MSVQDGRIHLDLRFSERRYAHRRSYHQRYCGGYRIRSSPRLYLGALATVQAWSVRGLAAVGHYLGYPHHVLVCFPRAPTDITVVKLLTIGHSISYGCSFIGGSKSDNWSAAAWRVPWGLQMIPAVLLFFAMMFLPESPRWLARMDRWEEAHDVLALVHAKGDRNHPFVAIELQDIRDMCELERSFKSVTYLDLFAPRMLNRTLIGLFTQIWSQLTGMNVMSKCGVRMIS